MTITPEPWSTGAVVAAALAHGANAFVNGAIGEGGKQLYHKLKEAIHKKRTAAEALEKAEARADEAPLIQAIDVLPESDRAALAQLAEALLAELKLNSSARAAIGAEARAIWAKRVVIEDFEVSGNAVGFRAGDVHTEEFRVGNFTVKGDQRGNP